MARIPQETVEEIMQRADIVEVVSQYVQLRQRGRNSFGLCPFHNEDTPSFSVNGDKQIFKCFGCGKGGNVIGFVQEVENLTFAEAARKLAETYHVTIPERELSAEERARQAERQSMLAAHAQAADFYATSLKSSSTAQSYMKKRGISEKMAVRFGLGYAPESDWQALYNHLRERGLGDDTLIRCGLVSRSAKNNRCYDKFHGRLLFPIRDERKTVVAFGGRSLAADQEPKYLNSQTTPIYNKSQVLFALDIAADSIRRAQQIVVMEGYMDVITAHAAGIDNAVASLGTAFTAEHIRLLNRYRPEAPAQLQVVLAFDGDAAGQKAAMLSLDKLAESEAVDARVVIFPEGKDPDDFIREQGLAGWQHLLKTSCYARLDYLLLRAREQRNPQTAADKGAIVAALKPAILKTRSKTEQNSFVSQLARQLQISEEAVRIDVFGKQQQPASQKPAAYHKEPIFRPGQPANRHLLIASLSNKQIFEQAVAELGENFASTDEEAALIDLVWQIKDEYDFRPSSLFNHIENRINNHIKEEKEENEGLRDFLLKLLDTDVPPGGNLSAGDYIKAIKKSVLARRISQLQRQIEAAESSNQDVTPLITEKLQLSKQLRQL